MSAAGAWLVKLQSIFPVNPEFAIISSLKTYFITVADQYCYLKLPC